MLGISVHYRGTLTTRDRLGEERGAEMRSLLFSPKVGLSTVDARLLTRTRHTTLRAMFPLRVPSDPSPSLEWLTMTLSTSIGRIPRTS